MQAISLRSYTQDSLNRLLLSIPFYRTIQQQDDYQYQLLLAQSKFIEFQSGEMVLREGQVDESVYFLLQGQLDVVVGKDEQSVNTITPGEVFGDLTVLLHSPRSASVKVDDNCRKAVVFCTDFKVFGELTDTRTISLATKLHYFRNVAHNLRWKLEMYRTAYPKHALASNHRKVKLYSGPKDTMDELISLEQQAKDLAVLLINWNEEFKQLPLQMQSPDSSSHVA